MPVIAQGRTGQITLHESGWITIERTGIGRVGHGNGVRQIPMSEVVTVEFKPAGWLWNGHLRIITPASRQVNQSQVNADENAIIFTKRQQADFATLRDSILAVKRV